MAPPVPPVSVRAYDKEGRQVEIPLETWRTTMLPNALAKAANDPNTLYNLIVEALNLNLAADILPSAQHLYATDPLPERGAVIYAIALMKTANPQTAEQILNIYLAQHGPSGVILTNLAKAQADLNRMPEAKATLWQALETDPNQENGLGWYATMERERDADDGWDNALKRVAALPNTWLPQLWLTYSAFKRNDTAQAITLFEHALATAGSPTPVLLLQTMSAELGKHNLLPDLLRLTLPPYDPKFHGLAVGNNLIKASIESHQLLQARTLVEDLYQQHRPDWASTLAYWESEIKQHELAATPPAAQPILTHFGIEGPVWLAPTSPFRPLFPAVPDTRPNIAFLGATVTRDTAGPTGAQLPDRSGRLTRLLPLFLAENAFLHLQLNTTTIVPWVETHGFALLGAPWSDADALTYARTYNADAIVLTHLVDSEETPTLTLRVLSVSTNALLLETTAPLTWLTPQDAASALWTSLRPTLTQLLNHAPIQPADLYTLPAHPDLADYLLRLEQLLAVRSSTLDDIPANFMTGERDIITGELGLVARALQSLPTRLILLATLKAMHKRRPEIVADYRPAAEQMQQRFPLPNPQANALLIAELESIGAPPPTNPPSPA